MYLGVGQHADDAAVLPQLVQLSLDLLLAVCVLLHVLGEGLLLGLGVVLVEPGVRNECEELVWVRQLFTGPGLLIKCSAVYALANLGYVN